MGWVVALVGEIVCNIMILWGKKKKENKRVFCNSTILQKEGGGGKIQCLWEK